MIAQTLEKCVAKDTMVKELPTPGVWRYTPVVALSSNPDRAIQEVLPVVVTQKKDVETPDFNAIREGVGDPLRGFSGPWSYRRPYGPSYYGGYYDHWVRFEYDL